MLESVCINVLNDKSLVPSLEKGKRYLKTRYQSHCLDQETRVFSHDANFALSDTKEDLLKANNFKVGEEVCVECFNLMMIIQKIKDAIEKQGNDDTKYDVEQAILAINEYIKHLIRDVQQHKAKTTCIDELDEKSAFWLRDFCQKILPVKFREGQQDYFGKKGMSLHVDVFFTKALDGELKKHTYLTAISRCDQAMVDILCIGDAVLEQFKKDQPAVTKIFTKSDNAGCYHGSLVPETLYHISKLNGFQLARYDFNEPCKGKDQCDRESATVKSLINSYVDNGNDLISAEDIFNALHHANGMSNTKVCVVQIDKNHDWNGEKIKNFSKYHSIEFHGDKMKMWRYYNIGDGVEEKYKGTNFKSTLKTILPFSSTEKHHGNKKHSKKSRDDRHVSSIIFCHEIDCKETFPNEISYDRHLQAGIHNKTGKKTSMDEARSIFANKMKVASQGHQPDYAMSQTLAEIDIKTACELYPTMSLFLNEGWALPTHTYFRFDNTQKKLLYKYFIEGEKSGKKMSPEQVEKLIRKDLPLNQYLTVKQIRSLFSRWSKQYRQGTLQEPSDNIIDEVVGSKEEEEEIIKENIAEQIENVVDEFNLNPDDWVVIKYGDEWFPGIILKVLQFHCMISFF